ncbi:MAG: hypothetical protein F4Z01_06900 [Gammaproteobacteria bacterium]|nr:hypothetical protein [Gammaproteobacteria bacterium]
MSAMIDTAYGESLRQFEDLDSKIHDVETMKQQASEAIGDESGEFGKALVDHFPVEDGMPTFSDVDDFVTNWCEWGIDDYDDDTVEKVCLIMEFIYPLNL